MIEKQSESLTRWVDLAFKILTPIGLAALFFLKSSFATKPELEAVGQRLDGVERAIAVMVEQNRVNDRQDSRLEDHEKRLRVVEAHAPARSE